MGVQGLTPFLQKRCPVVLKKLPNRLQDIQGKRIVIDGTLITQRLHFSQGYGACRHVLGWYRIAKELADNGVSAICVFDGQGRNHAKAREGERRHEVRRLAAARGSIENDRLQRLIQLKVITSQFQSFDVDKKRSVAERLSDVSLSLEAGAAAPLPQDTLQQADGDSKPSLQEQEPPPLYPSLKTPPSDIPAPITADPDQILNIIKSLSLNFKANVAKLASMPSEAPLLSADEEEDRVDLVMTKAQNQLTVDEGKVWEKIDTSISMYLKPAAPLDFPISTINDIHTLVDKSHSITTSFQRRTDIPTPQTYQECREILQAMGIPCIEATGAIEAEALASAMFHQGLADFVVTEDTDVLVYEAPMIKNITNRLVPLVIVSGAEVRAELDLDRNSFIDFALLLGTDFTQRIVNVGPMRAYKFIKDHGSIERIIELETKYKPKLSQEDYLAQIEIARLVFKTLPAVPSLEVLKTTPKDDVEVTRVLQHYGLSYALRGEADDFNTLLVGNYFGDNPTA
ncbi:PIN domain-like protein [Phlegmacium glaucopus]|nr:PIN domain-like protein [Phlegmacium glaucopus]